MKPRFLVECDNSEDWGIRLVHDHDDSYADAHKTFAAAKKELLKTIKDHVDSWANVKKLASRIKAEDLRG